MSTGTPSSPASSGGRDRRAYDDADEPATMARDASACRRESHLAQAAARVVAVPGTAAGAVRRAPHQVARAAIDVTDSAARFADRLFD
jgi:hypothetical protein